MVENVIIVNGPCGAGKSHLIAQKYPELPKIDMNNLRIEVEGLGITGSYDNYYHRMGLLESRLLSSVDKTLVIEGIFAPGTQSYRWLLGMLKRMSINFSFDHPDYTLAVALQRLINDYNKDWDEDRLRARAVLLLKYYKEF